MKDFPTRKNIRLKDYDYSSGGAYFITVCIADRRMLLWNNVGADRIRPEQPLLSNYGELVDSAIKAMSIHYPNTVVDKYCIMPDHIHMIIIISPEENGRIISAPTTLSTTLSTIIGQMKRWVSKQIGFTIWQKSFHDRIIRNEQEYRNIWQYIDQNPLKWEDGGFYQSL